MGWDGIRNGDDETEARNVGVFAGRMTRSRNASGYDLLADESRTMKNITAVGVQHVMNLFHFLTSILVARLVSRYASTRSQMLIETPAQCNPA